MADIMITRVKNGWMMYPPSDPALLTNPQDTSVARDTEQLTDLVRDWAVGVELAEREKKPDA